jgi:hypothetical protein
VLAWRGPPVVVPEAWVLSLGPRNLLVKSSNVTLTKTAAPERRAFPAGTHSTSHVIFDSGNITDCEKAQEPLAVLMVSRRRYAVFPVLKLPWHLCRVSNARQRGFLVSPS